MENGMDLSVEMSTMIATYLATGLVRSGVATREQASEILQEVADGLRQLDHDFPDEFKTNLRAANYLATARDGRPYASPRRRNLAVESVTRCPSLLGPANTRTTSWYRRGWAGGFT
jgi:hypothetical protein